MMQSPESASDRAIRMLKEQGMLRGKDFRATGIDRKTISRLVATGVIIPITSLTDIVLGYALSAGPAPVLRDEAMFEIAARHPHAVFCLQSALRFHDMTDDYNADFTAAVPQGANRMVSMRGAKLIQWRNPAMFETGVETVELTRGFPVRMTNVSRTLADLFRPEHQASDAVRERAIGIVAGRAGEAGLTLAAEYAAKLGWLNDIRDAVTAAKGALNWKTVAPKP